MNKKCLFCLLIVLSIGFACFAVDSYYKSEINRMSIIMDYKSASTLFAILNGKTEKAKKVLTEDVVRLISTYDQNQYSNIKLLDSFCNDWNLYIKDVMKEYLENHSDQSSVLREKMKIIQKQCTQE